MSLPPDLEAYHREQAAAARRLYEDALLPSAATEKWSEFKGAARKSIKIALRETGILTDIPGALVRSGHNAYLLRFLMAPPKSQDQFALICRAYSKSAENSGAGLSSERAEAVAAAFDQWRDRQLTGWMSSGASPSRRDIQRIFHHVAPMMALQKLQTSERGNASAIQERAVADMLLDEQWTCVQGQLIDRQTGIDALHFMKKARFAAGELTKEIDIAIGLGQTFILALECKVSNDATNSTKRLNDISEKAKAWKDEYGRRLKAGAVLQGVFRAEEVLSLAEGGIDVFWSHDLPRLSRWIGEQVRP